MVCEKYIDNIKKYIYLIFPIMLQCHNIQVFIEDSHVSPKIQLYWKCVDRSAIKLKQPKSPDSEFRFS